MQPVSARSRCCAPHLAARVEEHALLSLAAQKARGNDVIHELGIGAAYANAQVALER